MASEAVVEQEFGPDMAGKRVGWVYASEQERADAENTIMAGVTVATVGYDGGFVKHEVGDDGQWLHHRHSVEGFALASSVAVIIVDGTGDRAAENPSSWRGLSSGQHDLDISPISANHVVRVGANELLGVVPDTDQTWAVGNQEIVDTLKSKLAEFGMGRLYPSFYYLLNHFALHQDLRPRDRDQVQYFSHPYETGPIPDTSMHGQTHAEIEKARKLVYGLADQLGQDILLRTELAVLGDNAVDEFREARQKAHASEVEIREAEQQMVAGQALYLPTGFDFGGRTWPYMDAANADEGRAFGIELQAVEAGNYRRAHYELDREMDELNRRLTFALHGLRALRILEMAEDHVIESQTLEKIT